MKPSNEKMKKAEWDAQRDFLIANGATQAQVNDLYGTNYGQYNKLRKQQAADNAAWAKTLPKAVTARLVSPGPVYPAPTVKLLGRSVKIYDPSFPPTAAVISLIEKIWSTNGR